MLVKSLTEIKKNLNIKISTAKIYSFLEQEKIVEKKFRQSSKDPSIEKSYWFIIDDFYGYNSSTNFSEATTPKFFEEIISEKLKQAFKLSLE